MHLQLAAATKPALKEKTALRQLWAIIKYLLFVIFYLMRAVFSFLFGFLFIRVTIAKLTLGTHIESKDLVLVLQAKEAIEESAKYLKEYLITANTFDGRDEVYDAE
jgi:membrane protein required for beta-lactamase induction